MPEPVLIFGQGGGNVLYEGNSGFTDAGQVYDIRGRTNRLAPAGVGGEAIFPVLYIAVRHTMATTFFVQGVVESHEGTVELEPVEVVLPAAAERTVRRFELGLSVPLVNLVGAIVALTAPRGTWFHALVYTEGALSAGDLLFESLEVEHEVVRESQGALSA